MRTLSVGSLRPVCWISAVCLAMAAAGCGGQKAPDTVPISGTAKVDGAPKGDLELTFSNIAGGVPAKFRNVTVKTGSDGKYSIPAIAPAEYVVSVGGGSAAAAGGGPVAAVDTDPLAKYRADSPMKVTIGKEPNKTYDIDFVTK